MASSGWPSAERCPLPPEALLARYAVADGYADCYGTQVPRAVSHAEFVEAFYTGAVFRIERRLLALLLSRPSTDAQVRQLATGHADAFSAWRVEARAANQLLLCDVAGRTRSWLMVAPAPDGRSTRLYFGSAVVPLTRRPGERPSMGWAFTLLAGFHRLYSRVLLGAARSRLVRASARA